MKQRRRNDHCLNCQLKIEPMYNYCPQCGQDNTDNNVGILALLQDLYDDYITFDSRFIKSLKPFIFKPGELTNAFNAGHRIRYIHPVRFYILISLLYFFVFTHVFDFENLPFNNIDKALSDTTNTNQIDSLIPTEEVRQEILSDLADELDELKEAKGKAKSELKKKTKQEQIAYLNSQIDSFQKNPAALINEKVIKKKLKQIANKNKSNTGDSINISGSDKKYSILKAKIWLQDKNMTPQALLDSLEIKDKGTIPIKVATQALKIGRNDLSIFLQSAIDNIPIMMILLLPVMAFFLKLLYIRKGRLYIEHLVFAFHIQSFVYFISSLD
jgi:hypothetical protein